MAEFTDDIDLIEANCCKLFGTHHHYSVAIEKITRAAYEYMDEEQLLCDDDDDDAAGATSAADDDHAAAADDDDADNRDRRDGGVGPSSA